MKQSAAEILREYGPFPGVDQVNGVTDDGQNVWFASGDKLNALDPEMARGPLDRCRRACRHGFRRPSPVPASGDRIQKIDPKTGRVLATIPAPGGAGSGLAWAEGTLWMGQYRNRKIHQIDPRHRGGSSHHRIQPLRHRSHLGRRRALARHSRRRRERIAARRSPNRRSLESSRCRRE